MPSATPTVPTVGPKKRYRLVVSEEAPFSACTLAGHTFHQHTEPVIPDPKNPKGYRRGNVVGIIEPLLDETVQAIQAEMPLTYVRWINREEMIAQLFKPSKVQPMDPTTDEPVARFLSMTPAE